MTPEESGAAAVERAHEQGRVAGANLDMYVSNSPYKHDQRVLRSEWLKGFSKGRAELEAPRPVYEDHHELK